MTKSNIICCIPILKDVSLKIYTTHLENITSALEELPYTT